MRKVIWFINGFFGSLFGLGITGLAIYSIIKEFKMDYIIWLIIGLISLIFSIYQWKKFFN
ncbi:MAG: hypothetical protein Q7S27_01650 [Nanoarchaeota archaeon]|nr:hypothetical protein [Nanoarchaeota archaeon]